MAEFNSTTITQIGIAVLTILGGGILGIQKLTKSWKTTSAETSVVDLLHKELERLATQNTTLATELNKLQREIVSLNKKLGTLSTENQRLHTEVETLTVEVSELRGILDRRGPVNVITNKT